MMRQTNLPILASCLAMVLGLPGPGPGVALHGATTPPPGIGGGFRFGAPPDGDELAPSDGARLVKLDVIAPDDPVGPGTTAMLGIRLRIAPDWHVYWRNPGESGTAPKVKLSGPRDLVPLAMQWPRPVVFRGPWDTTYGYTGEVTLLQPVRIPADTPPGPLDLKVDVEWLVCKQACLLGEATRAVSLRIGQPGSDRARLDPAIQAALDLVPQPLSSLPEASAILDFEADPPLLRVEGPVNTAGKIEFLPDLTPGVNAGEGLPVEGVISEGRFRIEVPLDIEPTNAEGRPLEAAGLVTFGPRASDRAFSIRIPIPADRVSP